MGKLIKKSWTVIMDNDGGYWQYNGKLPKNDMSDEDGEAWIEAEMRKMEDKYGSPNGYHDVVDILNAAGVPADWV